MVARCPTSVLEDWLRVRMAEGAECVAARASFTPLAFIGEELRGKGLVDLEDLWVRRGCDLKQDEGKPMKAWLQGLAFL